MSIQPPPCFEWSTNGTCGVETESRKELRFPKPRTRYTFPLAAGWSSPVARQAHNLKVAGSNPAPATNFLTKDCSPALLARKKGQELLICLPDFDQSLYSAAPSLRSAPADRANRTIAWIIAVGSATPFPTMSWPL